MIARHTRGRPQGLVGAVPARVTDRQGEEVVLVDDTEAALVLSPASGEGRAAGVYGLQGAPPYEVGDVVLVDPGGSVELLFRPGWRHNSLLVTQRCDSLCVMCSQPPKDVDDGARVDALIRAVRLLPADAASVGITGGEPTLLGARLVDLVRALAEAAPAAGVHVLSNGRGFRDAALARALGRVRHPDLMVGVPLYSDVDDLHDEVVGRAGAFVETMRGLEHLARAGVRIEIRVVVHRLTAGRLVPLARFLARNLPYVSQVVWMGLEPTGFAVPNLAALWVDPVDSAEALAEAVELLAVRGMATRVYNVQLCTVPRSLWSHATRSISEWKNEYLPACAGCAVREDCGGFFSSAVERSAVSRAIMPVPVSGGLDSR